MAWDEDDLRADLLEEFGYHQSVLGGGEDNLWLAQAEAGREYGRQRRARAARDKVEAGECLDCDERAVPGRRRCATHLAKRSANTIAYQRRQEAAGYPLTERARVRIAEVAAARAAARRAARVLRESACAAERSVGSSSVDGPVLPPVRPRPSAPRDGR